MNKTILHKKRAIWKKAQTHQGNKTAGGITMLWLVRVCANFSDEKLWWKAIIRDIPNPYTQFWIRMRGVNADAIIVGTIEHMMTVWLEICAVNGIFVLMSNFWLFCYMGKLLFDSTNRWNVENFPGLLITNLKILKRDRNVYWQQI
jgi:hypothetical protein